jgi:type III restriction enzyme
MTVQHFKQMAYQEAAAQSVVDCFTGQPRIEGLSYQIDPGREANPQASLLGDVGFRNADLKLAAPQLVQNIRAVQIRQHLPPSSVLTESKAAPVNLDVEMETGTGKTYVYIDTMYRLYRDYGWSKFIVVVPSVAIREGVFQTFEDTEDHFQALYGHKVRRFIYDSSRPEPILAFSDSPGLHCMIINTQAFASEVKAEGSESKTLRMFREMDQFGSRRPIDLIAANRPILILDEPQRLEGAATQGALGRFKAPIALRYSATHKTRHNLVHRLDALDAYNRKLVKRISVRGVTVRNLPGTNGYLYLASFRTFPDGRSPEARVHIEYALQGGSVKRRHLWLRKGDDFEDKSGGLAEYGGYTVSDVDLVSRTLSFTNGEVIEEGRVVGDVDEAAVRRIQIRETIRAHFERERLLFPRGIKVLSLFFIDEVAKYRRYGEDGDPLPGEYAAMFEEEYRRAVGELPELDASDAAWHAYARRDDAGRVHDGYFSIDKKGRMVDPDVNRRGEEVGEAKDASSYDLILKNKARLLSIDEPVRFIFSHSTLREGWDNPNVFTICTLKQSDHEIGKRQEVGRGLRISVDSNGDRTDDPSIVHDINVLTVVASESYEAFAQGLQDEMAKALEGRPRKANAAYFKGQVLKTDTGTIEVTEEQADALEFWLIQNGYVDRARQIAPKWHEAKENGTVAQLPPELAGETKGFIALVDTVFDESALRRLIGNGRKTVQLRVVRENLEKKAFQELWSRINQKAVYFSDFDSNVLVKAAVQRLDRDLSVLPQVIVVSGANLQTGIDVEQVRRGTVFAEERERYEVSEQPVESKIRYDLVGQLALLTRLTRATAGKILRQISPKTFALFGRNPEQFLRKAADLIRREKVRLAIETLRYEKTGDRYDVSIFETDRPEVAIDRAVQVSDHVYDYVAVDSDTERTFAKRLEAAEEVVVYAKLPRGFTIPTPGGNYNPDWAIALEANGLREIYLVAETKAAAEDEELRASEKQNIDSAKRYFSDVATNVTFRKIDSYDALIEAIT